MKFVLNTMLVFIAILASLMQNVHSRKNKILILKEDNWKECLDGEWMIKFYAPWCPACRANEPEFEKFSDWSDELNIKVGMVDITKEPGLSGRFMVTALPSFYHVKEGEFRRYKGDYQAGTLQDYIEAQSWKHEEPVSWIRHPDTFQMTAMSLMFRTSIYMKDIHEMLTETYGYPYWVSYCLFAAGTIITGLVLGLVFVCIIDFIFPPKRKPSESPQKLEKITKEMEKKAAETEDDESTAEISGSETEGSQVEELTQKSSHASQEWETIKDNEIEQTEDGQLRKRIIEQETSEEAGDASKNQNE